MSFVATSTAGSDNGFPGDLVSFHTLKAAARRRRKLWVSTAVVGLVLGSLFHLAVPRKYSAVAELYLVEPSDISAQQGIGDDASLLQTQAVAAAAETRLHLHLTSAAFLSHYTSTVVSDDLVTVTLTAHSAAEAVRWDEGLASAFLAFRANEVRSQNTIQVANLDSQISALDTAIGRLTTSIDALTGSGGSSSASQVNQLTDEEADDSGQVATLKSDIQQDDLSLASVVQGSRLLDPASAVKHSAKKVFVVDGLSGLVAGLAVGLGIVVLAAVLSDRLRWRRDVAAALGVPVELSVGRHGRRRLVPGSSPQRLLARPTPAMQAMADSLSDRLHAAFRPTLTVVSVGADEPAALAVALLARSLASEGRRVALADFTTAQALAGIFAGHRGGHAVEGPGSVALVAAGGNPSVIAAQHPPADPDVLIAVTNVDPAVGSDHLAPWDSDVVVVVGAGRATATRLTTTVALLRHAGFSVQSAILVGADAGDDTLGGTRAGLRPRRAVPQEQLAAVVQAREW